MIALGSSLAAGPNLLKNNVASLKLALPAALIASGFSIVGALSGLKLSQFNPAYIQVSLGILIIIIVLFMAFFRQYGLSESQNRETFSHKPCN